MISENRIVRRNKGSELIEFGYLYDQYASGLWGLILKFTTDSVSAEKILEESFINIWNHIEEYDLEKTTLPRWMVSITVSQCVRRLNLSKTELIDRIHGLKH
jgi:RNA polymerase sigma-70 factor (ECF subfamily)